MSDAADVTKKVATGIQRCSICGQSVGAEGFLNVGPNHARNTFRDSDDHDFVIWESVGPCGHILFSGSLSRNELPPPPIADVDLNALQYLSDGVR